MLHSELEQKAFCWHFFFIWHRLSAGISSRRLLWAAWQRRLWGTTGPILPGTVSLFQLVGHLPQPNILHLFAIVFHRVMRLFRLRHGASCVLLSNQGRFFGALRRKHSHVGRQQGIGVLLALCLSSKPLAAANPALARRLCRSTQPLSFSKCFLWRRPSRSAGNFKATLSCPLRHFSSIFLFSLYSLQRADLRHCPVLGQLTSAQRTVGVRGEKPAQPPAVAAD